jgi:hypothetical protein
MLHENENFVNGRRQTVGDMRRKSNAFSFLYKKLFAVYSTVTKTAAKGVLR